MKDYQKMYYALYYAAASAERRNTEAAKLLREVLNECDRLFAESLREPAVLPALPSNEAAEE